MEIDLRGNKLLFTSLGCPRNLVDTEVMLGIALRSGYEVVEKVEEADYLVVNTCGFLAAAREESIETINTLSAQKKPTAKMIATGCMVQRHKDELKAACPEIHYFLGAGNVAEILIAIESEEKGEQISTQRSYLETGEVPRQRSTPDHYAYLKIAEGCKKACAYCIIPSIKGKLKSKSQEQILKEFHLLLDQGVSEIILIAQDLGDYGKDRGEYNGLAELLTALLNTDKDFWLRLLYLYPDEINDDIIALMKNDRRICAYLDMPIQHINNQVLRAMRRTTTREEIIASIDKLREEIPGVVIRTSLIVGFPGETEEQFEELMEFVADYALDNVGVFKYSIEEGSLAARMEGHIPEEIKEERYQRLMELQAEIVEELNEEIIGQTLEVVIEGYHPESELLMVGRFYGQCPGIDSQVIINDGQKVNGFGKKYLVKITDSAAYDLIGAVIEEIPSQRTKTSLTMVK